MGEIKRLCSSSSSYSLKLVLLVVPLIVVSGFMGLLGPKNSNWRLRSPVTIPSPSSGVGVLLGANSSSSVSSEEGSGAHLDEIDWRWRLVGGGTGNVHRQEDAIPDHESVKLDGSPGSPPPFAVEAIEIQTTVSALFSSVSLYMSCIEISMLL